MLLFSVTFAKPVLSITISPFKSGPINVPYISSLKETSISWSLKELLSNLNLLVFKKMRFTNDSSLSLESKEIEEKSNSLRFKNI